MRVVLSTVSKFYTFDLARQLERLGVLERLFTGRPRWKMRHERLPLDKVSTFPAFQTVYEAMGRFGFAQYPLKDELDWLCHSTLDSYIARRMPECDVYHALAYCGLRSGRAAQHAGAPWVCDAPTGHTVVQERLVSEEFERMGLRYPRKSPKLTEYEVESYAGADLIVVGSHFARRTFVSENVPDRQIAVVPYGADLSEYRPLERPRDGRFRVLFVGQLSMRKGLHDVLQGFRLAELKNASLTLVGPSVSETEHMLARAKGVQVELAGARSKAELAAYYSRSDVLVLPSIADGFGLVVGEAFACGCPAITSENTGASDIVTPGLNGFVVPIRSPMAIAERLVWLQDHPEEREAMRQEAVAAVRRLGGWDSYGDQMLALYRSLDAA